MSLDPKIEIDDPLQFLLADSPRLMRVPFTYTPDLDSHAKQEYPPPLNVQGSDGPPLLGSFDAIELPRVIVTSYGVGLRLPVFKVDGVTVAVLLCETRREHFGLFLQRDPCGKDPTRPRYHVGCVYFTHSQGESSTEYMARLAINLGDDLYNLRFDTSASTRAGAPSTSSPVPPTGTPGAQSRRASQSTCVQRHPFASRIGCCAASRRSTLSRTRTRSPSTPTSRRSNSSTARSRNTSTSSSGCATSTPPQPRAARARTGQRSRYPCSPPKPTHNCAEDHIASRTAPSRVFGDMDRAVRLFVIPCPWMPETTLVIHMELCGRIYEAMLRESNVSFPSVEDLTRPPRLAASLQTVASSRPRPSLQVEPAKAIASRSSSASSMTALRRLSRIPRPVSISRKLEAGHVQGASRESFGRNENSS